MKVLTAACLGLALLGASAAAQEFPPEQIKTGADLFARNCATCHGARMRNPQWAAVNLRTFPRDARSRFIDTVTNGRRTMPPWDDVLQPEQIEALWAYVMAGEPAD